MKEFYDLKLHGTRNRQRYLDNTDWIAIKSFETGIPEDQAAKDKRQLARDEISLLRDTTNPDDYNLIEHLTEEF